MFQYETTNDAFNIKIRNAMNYFQIQCSSHIYIFYGTFPSFELLQTLKLASDLLKRLVVKA